MGIEGIYRKTEKGRAEIATRANKLGLRERTMLIMVDDKTTRSGLLAKNAHPASGEILDALLAHGFIEIASGTAAAAASPRRLHPPPLHPRRRCRGRPRGSGGRAGRGFFGVGLALRLPYLGDHSRARGQTI